MRSDALAVPIDPLALANETTHAASASIALSIESLALSIESLMLASVSLGAPSDPPRGRSMSLTYCERLARRGSDVARSS